MNQPKYRPSAHTPSAGWSLVVNALAELGAWEIERRKRAAQQQPENAQTAVAGGLCDGLIEGDDHELLPS